MAEAEATGGATGLVAPAAAPVVATPPETTGIPLDKTQPPTVQPWLEGAKPEHQADVAFQRYGGLDALLDGFKTQSAHLGVKTGEIPGGEGRPVMPHADMPQDERVTFFKGLDGAPEDSTKYTLQALDVPEGTIDPVFMRSLLNVAAEHGIQDWQMQPLQEVYQAGVLAQLETLSTQDTADIAQTMTTLEGVWHGSLDRNLTIVDEHLRRTYGDKHPFLDIIMRREDGQGVLLKNMPEFIQLTFKAAMADGTDKFVPTSRNGMPQGADFAKEQIQNARNALTKKEITSDQANAVIAQYGPAANSRR